MTTAWIEVALVPQSEIAVSRTRPAGVEISTTTTEVQIQTYPAPQIEVAIGLPGPPGPPGDSTVTATAGAAISALRAVYEQDGKVYLLDAHDADHVDLLLGVAVSAAAAGGSVLVQRLGRLSDAGWSWSTGRVWLGANGSLTQVPPASGFDLEIGSATSATEIIIDTQPPIAL